MTQFTAADARSHDADAPPNDPAHGSHPHESEVLAAKRKHEQVPPELFLMALTDEGGGVGAQVLASFGATAARVREIVDGPTS